MIEELTEIEEEQSTIEEEAIKLINLSSPITIENLETTKMNKKQAYITLSGMLEIPSTDTSKKAVDMLIEHYPYLPHLFGIKDKLRIYVHS